MHWAAELGLDSLVEALLAAYAAAAARAEQAAATLRTAAKAAGAGPEELAALGGGALPAAAEVLDRQGCTPLHLAAGRSHCATLAVLLTGRCRRLHRCASCRLSACELTCPSPPQQRMCPTQARPSSF